MSIFIGSRYENAAVDRVPDKNGVQRPTVFAPPVGEHSAVQTYLVVEGDRLDALAYHYYGRADLWWVIADANPAMSLPDPLVPGDIIRIPDGRSLR